MPPPTLNRRIADISTALRGSENRTGFRRAMQLVAQANDELDPRESDVLQRLQQALDA